MKKSLQLVSWNTMKQGKPKNNRWFLSDTFYPPDAEAFRTKQTLHRIYNLGFFKGNKERAEKSSPCPHLPNNCSFWRKEVLRKKLMIEQ